ncbi:MAG: glycogen/starch synthase [Bacteroidaceae bacterium]|nr:glycogen/starch synthase [Bacteroidaceae bacterium]
MKAKNILYVTTEMVPFVPETPLARRYRILPQAIQESNHEIRTFMPKWGVINERRNQLHEVIRLSGMNLIMNEQDHTLQLKVASIQPARMQIYFIDNEDFFRKKGIGRDSKGREYANNGDRTIFFARGVLETIKKLGWSPDIIHCVGWTSTLTPLMVKRAFNDEPAYAGVKVIYSATAPALERPAGKNFMKSLVYKDITANDIADISTNDVSFDQLQMIALKYSDGLILEDDNVSQCVIDYAKSIGLPVLPYQPSDDCKQVYEEFYELVANRE